MNRSLTDAAGKSVKFVDVGDGFLVPHAGYPSTPLHKCKEYFRYIPHFKCRLDDVMLLSYPSTGSNWLYEILGKLLNRSAEPVTNKKISLMLEFHSQEEMDSVASPRVPNTHVPYRFLSSELEEKQVKTVLIVRNPKDTMVSLYNHIRAFREHGYDGQWGDFLQMYMQGQMMYGLYSDYLKGFEKAITSGPGFPLHLVHYEDLKHNGVDELKKLAKFLDVDVHDDMCAAIVQKCKFETMVKEQPHPEEFKKKLLNQGYDLYRKGQVGDWKNWFTVAESEQFDAYWEKEMAGYKMNFTYSS